MKKEFEYYEKIKNWSFNEFDIRQERLTNWDMYEELNKIATKDSKILDLGTGGGEKLLKYFPDCKKIVGTDFSPLMIETANKNLLLSGRKNISFKVMDNLAMDEPEKYYDIVVARNTVTDPVQIYKCLKKGGYLLIHDVDKYDCLALKMKFKRGQGMDDVKPISIVDYENVLNAGFKDVELIPIHVREFYKNKEIFKNFLKKAPIINEFDSSKEIEDDILDSYIEDNTHNGEIIMLRRYYGISAKK